MTVPVVVFNASTQAVFVTVNQGAQIQLGQSGSDVDWAPAPQTPGQPTYQPGYPQPNVIGNTGVNTMQAYLAGVPIGGAPFYFAVPSGTIIGSIQIYFFFETVQSVSWLVLADGKPFAQQALTNLALRNDPFFRA